MINIKLITIGRSLGTRAQAESLRKKIVAGTLVEFDFEGVSIVSNSFADELFGVYVQEHGLEQLLQNVRIKNTNSEVTSTIKKAIYSRM